MHAQSSLFVATFALCTALVPAPARAAASVETDLCRVTLTKLSYDDPGADDAEFLELTVERLALHDADDAGADASAGGDGGGGVLTLADCGLASIDLIGENCKPYRTIPLADIVVPDDDVVVLCPADAAGLTCDVTTAGRSALRAGWLQNGPSDGLRLLGTTGQSVELGYEGGPSCFAPGALHLADESGEVPPSGSGIDDVSALCDGAFVLLPSTDAPAGAVTKCPSPGAPAIAEDGGPVASHDGASPHRPTGSDDDEDASVPSKPWIPERAPAPPESPGDDSVWRVDASVTTLPGGRPPPTPPGCAVATHGTTTPRGAAALIGLGAALAALVVRVRRRPRRLRSTRASALRAGSAARCGWSPSRSPSR